MRNSIMNETPTPSKKACFQFLAKKLNMQLQIEQNDANAIEILDFELNQYLNTLSNEEPANGNIKVMNCPLEYWLAREVIFPHLSHVARLDLIVSVPCSQAFVERTFSQCGLLTAGRRSQM